MKNLFKYNHDCTFACIMLAKLESILLLPNAIAIIYPSRGAVFFIKKDLDKTGIFSFYTNLKLCL